MSGIHAARQVYCARRPAARAVGRSGGARGEPHGLAVARRGAPSRAPTGASRRSWLQSSQTSRGGRRGGPRRGAPARRSAACARSRRSGCGPPRARRGRAAAARARAARRRPGSVPMRIPFGAAAALLPACRLRVPRPRAPGQVCRPRVTTPRSGSPEPSEEGFGYAECETRPGQSCYDRHEIPPARERPLGSASREGGAFDGVTQRRHLRGLRLVPLPALRLRPDPRGLRRPTACPSCGGAAVPARLAVQHRAHLQRRASRTEATLVEPAPPDLARAARAGARASSSSRASTSSTRRATSCARSRSRASGRASAAAWRPTCASTTRPSRAATP